MFGIKERLYHLIVDHNRNISSYYHAFVEADPERHRKHPLGSYWYLLKLNIIFRLLGGAWFGNRMAQLAGNARGSDRTPYLDGAESKAYSCQMPIRIAHKYRDCDLVSFDIFDTLILRPLDRPADLFFMVGEKLGILKFQQCRIAAEREARELAYEKYGHSEVTIYDIYERVAAMTGIDPEAGVRTEFETELDLCYANPFMRDIVKSLRADGKRIVAVSDMYLPKKLMNRLLEKCGYHGFDDVLVSCDHNCSKREGALFNVLKSKYPDAKKIVHFGDNKETDVKGAEAAGIEFHYYRRSVHSFGTCYRPSKMSAMIGSAYRGIVNAHLHNGKHQYSVPYEFGFIYGGIYLFGYCHWIHEYCLNNKIDKVLFLSRDGEITRKVFQLLYDDIPNDYCYWSRSATICYCTDCGLRYYAISRLFNEYINSSGDSAITVRQMFEQLKLPRSFYRHLADYRIDEDGILISQRDNLRRLFSEHAAEIEAVHAEEAEVLKGYLDQIVGDSKRLALVDVGLTGGSPYGLKRFIKSKMDPSKELFVLLAIRKDIDPWHLQNGEMNVYICSPTHNCDILEDFLNQRCLPYTCFETFHDALHPSFHHFEVHNGEPSFSFGSLEFENYPMIREMQKGILDFCRIYRDTFRNYPYMFNISGADAVAPYRLLIPYVAAFMSEHFPDYVRTHYTPFDPTQSPLLFRDLIEMRS